MWIIKWINILTKTQQARVQAEAIYATGKRPRRLLSRGNAKLMKSDRTIGLSLAPAQTSGYEICASRSPECTIHCIHTSGHGGPNFHAKDLPCNPVWVARVLKTLWFFRDRAAFMDQLFRDVANNRDASIRLNVFSDWMWERQSLLVSADYGERYGVPTGRFSSLMEVFPQTQFYDYTKHAARMHRPRPKNYHLTFSLTETNEVQARRVLSAGMNVAAVVTSKKGFLLGSPIIDGYEDDLRHLDPKGSVVGLKPKGTLRNITSDFIHDPTPIQWSPAAAA